MEKEDKVAYLLKWEIIYRPEQKPVIDNFVEYCRTHGYNRVAGLQTLLETADVHRHITILGNKILDVEAQLKKPKDAKKPPKTLGGGNDSPKKK